jgi:hypothetical protein
MRKRRLNWSIPHQSASRASRPAPAGQKCWLGDDGMFDQERFIRQLLTTDTQQGKVENHE